MGLVTIHPATRGSLPQNTDCLFLRGYFLFGDLFMLFLTFIAKYCQFSVPYQALSFIVFCLIVMTSMPAFIDHCFLDHRFCFVCLIGLIACVSKTCLSHQRRYSFVVWICLLNTIKLLAFGSYILSMSSSTAPSQY